MRISFLLNLEGHTVLLSLTLRSIGETQLPFELREAYGAVVNAIALLVCICQM